MARTTEMFGRRVLDWPGAEQSQSFDILTNKVINLTKMPELRALVVDDDDLIRSNVAEVLSNEGWDVTEAESAERALALLRDGAWSLVFCDVKLSGNNDFE